MCRWCKYIDIYKYVRYQWTHTLLLKDMVSEQQLYLIIAQNIKSITKQPRRHTCHAFSLCLCYSSMCWICLETGNGLFVSVKTSGFKTSTAFHTRNWFSLFFPFPIPPPLSAHILFASVRNGESPLYSYPNALWK